jgi:hypothetical protein
MRPFFTHFVRAAVEVSGGMKSLSSPPNKPPRRPEENALGSTCSSAGTNH